MDLDRVAKAERKLRGATGSELREKLVRIAHKLNLEERFDLLHRLGVYHGDESASGDASGTEATASIRAFLPGLIRDLRIASLIDAPCGDCHWMGLIDFCGVDDYLGIDIVAELVEQNVLRYGSAGRRFMRADVTCDPLPSADLLICRDLLIHLGDEDVLAALKNISASGIRWLLTTSFSAARNNADIVSGSFRPIALEAPPFSLSRPYRMAADTDAECRSLFPDRVIALWPVTSIRERLGILEHG